MTASVMRRDVSFLLLVSILVLGSLVLPGSAPAAVDPMPSDRGLHMRVRELLADLGPPVTSLSTSPMNPNGDSGWFKGAAPTVTPSAVDAEGSEPTVIYYDWGVDPPTTIYASTHTAPVGESVLFYRAADSVGNVEAVKSLLFKVDTGVAPPIVSAPVGSDVTPSRVDGTIEFEAVTADAVSGVALVEFFYFGRDSDGWDRVGTRIGTPQFSPAGEADLGGIFAGGSTYGVSWNTLLVPDGDYRLEVQVRDVAGNTAFSAPQYVTVDNWDPSSTHPNPPRY